MSWTSISKVGCDPIQEKGQLRSHSSCNCMKAVLRWQSVLKQAQVAFEAMQSGGKCQQSNWIVKPLFHALLQDV